MIYCHRFRRRWGWLFLEIRRLLRPSVLGCLFWIREGSNLCGRKCLVLLCFFGCSRLLSWVGFGAGSPGLLFRIRSPRPSRAILLLCRLFTSGLLFLGTFISFSSGLWGSSWNQSLSDLYSPICWASQAWRFYHCQVREFWIGDQQIMRRDLWEGEVERTNRRSIAVRVHSEHPSNFRHHILEDFRGSRVRWETVCICLIWQAPLFVTYLICY